jgi:SAM-dependent methyltransferase
MIYYPRRLSPSEVRGLYSTEYFDGTEYFNYLADRAVHEANFKIRLRQLGRWIPDGSRVFEIGCSYGFFLHVARDRWNVRGCDISEEPCRYAKDTLGLDVTCGDFLSVPLERAEIDAFCLWDTIEHLEDAEAYLARVADLLAPGGVLAMTTGDVGSLLARWQGPRWRQIHPPTHILYFSRAAMRSTLGRFGFDVVSLRHVSMSRSLGQIAYGLAGLSAAGFSWLSRVWSWSRLDRLRIRTNTFDLMMAVARRR